MSFIGPVNVLSSTAGIFARQRLEQPSPQIYLRPHDVLIQTANEEDFAPAKINRIVYLGWEIQIELIVDDREIVTAYLDRDRFKELNVKTNQQVYVKPRQARAFPVHS